MSASPLGFFFSNYLLQIPTFIVWLGALLIALSRRRRQPRLARLTVIALLIFFARALFYPLIQYLILSQEMTATRTGLYNGLLGVTSSLIGALAWILLFIALFRASRHQ